MHLVQICDMLFEQVSVLGVSCLCLVRELLFKRVIFRRAFLQLKLPCIDGGCVLIDNACVLSEMFLVQTLESFHLDALLVQKF